MVGAARTIKHHWDGVLQWFESRINNGILEGIDGSIQACKARARGCRSRENLISMIYLIAGKLQIGLSLKIARSYKMKEAPWGAS